MSKRTKNIKKSCIKLRSQGDFNGQSKPKQIKSYRNNEAVIWLKSIMFVNT